MLDSVSGHALGQISRRRDFATLDRYFSAGSRTGEGFNDALLVKDLGEFATSLRGVKGYENHLVVPADTTGEYVPAAGTGSSANGSGDDVLFSPPVEVSQCWVTIPSQSWKALLVQMKKAEAAGTTVI